MNPMRVRPALAGDLSGSAWAAAAATAPGRDSDRWFVLEDVAGRTQARVIACLQVRENLAAPRPGYWFCVGEVVRISEDLGLARRDRQLLLGNDFAGAREFVALHGAPDTAPALLSWLVRGAIALLPPAPTAADPWQRTIMALPGIRVEGRMPLWEGLGRHFCDVDLDQQLARNGSEFLTDMAPLLPSEPILASLLAADAQHAIGQVDESAKGLQQAIEAAGFKRGQHVAIHDGGPVYEYIDDPRGRTPDWRGPLRPSPASPAQTWMLHAADADCVWFLAGQREGEALAVEVDADWLSGASPHDWSGVLLRA